MKRTGLNFDVLINSDHYYLTNIDVWLIANFYKIPLVFISSTKLVENNLPLLVTKNQMCIIYCILQE